MLLKKKIFYLGFTLNQNNMNKLLNLYFLVAMVSINAQVTYIQGGGTLDDWAHLKKYEKDNMEIKGIDDPNSCLLYTSPSPRDRQKSRMPSSA